MARLKSLGWGQRYLIPMTVALTLLLGGVGWWVYSAYRAPVSVPPDPGLERLKQVGTEVQREFALGTFRQGDPVDRLLTEHPPTLVIHHPPYATLYYRNRADEPDDPSREVEVVAKDGRLVQATTYIATESRVYRQVRFFGDGLLLFSSEEYRETLRAGVHRWREAVANAVMAVTGAAAVDWEPSP